ncbi:hypothetical protein [Halorubrum sp. BV1]|nr:hypothetical protein [Halorubrum sp. BV1]
MIVFAAAASWRGELSAGDPDVTEEIGRASSWGFIGSATRRRV